MISPWTSSFSGGTQAERARKARGVDLLDLDRRFDAVLAEPRLGELAADLAARPIADQGQHHHQRHADGGDLQHNKTGAPPAAPVGLGRLGCGRS